MKSDLQIIDAMLKRDLKLQKEGKLNRHNAFVYASSAFKKARATARGGEIVVKVDKVAVGEIAHGDRIGMLYLIDAKEYERMRKEADEKDAKKENK